MFFRPKLGDLQKKIRPKLGALQKQSSLHAFSMGPLLLSVISMEPLLSLWAP